MKRLASLLALLATATGSVQAMTIDAKALARFDRSYVVCEAKFPAMKGHRDEAYLAMWRVKPDEKSQGDLAAARKGASYRQEQTRLQKGGANAAAAAASSPIEQQCQALWAEALGTPKARP